MLICKHFPSENREFESIVESKGYRELYPNSSLYLFDTEEHFDDIQTFTLAYFQRTKKFVPDLLFSINQILLIKALGVSEGAILQPTKYAISLGYSSEYFLMIEEATTRYNSPDFYQDLFYLVEVN